MRQERDILIIQPVSGHLAMDGSFVRDPFISKCLFSSFSVNYRDNILSFILIIGIQKGWHYDRIVIQWQNTAFNFQRRISATLPQSNDAKPEHDQKHMTT
jgi:hypothetical protein